MIPMSHDASIYVLSVDFISVAVLSNPKSDLIFSVWQG